MEIVREKSEIPINQEDLIEEAHLRGYEQGMQHAKGMIAEMVKGRIAEIVGDWQPAPALRAELTDLLKRIERE